MCGIIGFNASAPLTKGQAERFAQSLANLSIRGSSSCGVALAKGNKLHIRRWLKSPVDVTDEVAQLAEGAIMGIGHARMPTVGAVTLHNAHPLVCDKIALVHNGSVHNHKRYKAPGDPEVDSYALARVFRSGNFRDGIGQLGELEWSGAFLAISTLRPCTILAVAQTSLDLIVDRASKVIWLISEQNLLSGLLTLGNFPDIDVPVWSSRDNYYGEAHGRMLLVGPSTVRDLGPPPRAEIKLPPLSLKSGDNSKKTGTCFLCTAYGAVKYVDGQAVCYRCYQEVTS